MKSKPNIGELLKRKSEKPPSATLQSGLIIAHLKSKVEERAGHPWTFPPKKIHLVIRLVDLCSKAAANPLDVIDCAFDRLDKETCLRIFGVPYPTVEAVTGVKAVSHAVGVRRIGGRVKRGTARSHLPDAPIEDLLNASLIPPSAALGRGDIDESKLSPKVREDVKKLRQALRSNRRLKKQFMGRDVYENPA